MPSATLQSREYWNFKITISKKGKITESLLVKRELDVNYLFEFSPHSKCIVTTFCHGEILFQS